MGRAARSLAGQLLLLQVLVVLGTCAVGAITAVLTAQRRADDAQREQVLDTARTLSLDPVVVRGLEQPPPQPAVQALAERVRRATGSSFVVAMSPAGIRYSHPDPRELGRRYIGATAAARAGRELTETRRGTLGLSVRAVVPVRDGGRIVGLVAVGVLREQIAAQVRAQLPAIVLTTGLALALGLVLSGLLARRVRRQTLGLEPEEIAAVYEHHDAVLRSMGEGVAVVDERGVLRLLNAEARRLLGLDERAVGRRVAELGLQERVAAVLGGRGALDAQLATAGSAAVLAARRPAVVRGRPVGTVTALRDRTEVEDLTGRLDAVEELAASLRAQTHEAANELHTVVGLVELGRTDDAIAFATGRAAGSQALLGRLGEALGEPALVALLVGKAAQARERGVLLEVTEESHVAPRTGLPATDLVTIVGNLVDNALDAAGEGGSVAVTLEEDAGALRVRVHDDGPGFGPGGLDAAARDGRSTKDATGRPAGRGVGLGLVRRTVERLGGTLEAVDDEGARIDVVLPLRRPAAAPT